MTPPSVWLLHHVHEFPDGREDVKLIGVYSTEARARAALERVRDQPGFRDHSDGFEINEHDLDRDGWTEGFVTVD